MDISSSGMVDTEILGLGALPTGAEVEAKALKRKMLHVQAKLAGQNPHPAIAKDTFYGTQPDVQFAALKSVATKKIGPPVVMVRRSVDRTPVRGGGGKRIYHGTKYAAQVDAAAKAAGLGADSKAKKKPASMYTFSPSKDGRKIEVKIDGKQIDPKRTAQNIALAGGYDVVKNTTGASGLSRMMQQPEKSAQGELVRVKAAAQEAGIDPNLFTLKRDKKSFGMAQIAPIAGAVVGTFIAPGVGTALGASLGSAVGKEASGGKLGWGDALGIAGSAVGAAGGVSGVASMFGESGASVGGAMITNAAGEVIGQQVSSSPSFFQSLATAFNPSGSNPSSGGGGGILGNLLNGNGGSGGSLGGAIDSWSNLFDSDAGGFSLSNIADALGGTFNALGGRNIVGGLAQNAIRRLTGQPPAPGAPGAPPDAPVSGPAAPVRAPGSSNPNTMLIVGGVLGLGLILVMSSRKR